MDKEIDLQEGIKLVSFITKGGIYVYKNSKLIGTILSMTLVEIVKGE
ncbi:hypothetical protein KAX02_09305 [candidate division WOR-3 bacterium]|nr:hypothetical protein [candidate division WOR-3 bacterium]